MRLFSVCWLAFLSLGSIGCGTTANIYDAPDGTASLFLPGHCFPFGGVTRSAYCVYGGAAWGAAAMCEAPGKFKQGETTEGLILIGAGTYSSSVGLLAIVDIPFSLAGDIITLPIADARSKRKPWATWWGQQSKNPTPGEGDGNGHPAVDAAEWPSKNHN